MTVDELGAVVARMQAAGLGSVPVQLQVVVDGYTAFREVGASESPPQDGAPRLWVWTKGPLLTTHFGAIAA